MGRAAELCFARRGGGVLGAQGEAGGGGGGDAPAPAPRRMEDEKSLEEQLAEFEALKSEEGL